jgi:hypothetical protein
MEKNNREVDINAALDLMNLVITFRETISAIPPSQMSNSFRTPTRLRRMG